jgi:hypothetical protein
MTPKRLRGVEDHIPGGCIQKQSWEGRRDALPNRIIEVLPATGLIRVQSQEDGDPGGATAAAGA